MTVNDLESEGRTVCERLNGAPGDQLWWYDALATTFTKHADAVRADGGRTGELQRLAQRMRDFNAPS